MPYAAKKFLTHPLREEVRGTPAERGYDSRWRKERLAYLADHPLCVECEKVGRVVAATVVDHIVPHRGNKRLFWAVGNWQSLCGPCHQVKTAKGL